MPPGGDGFYYFSTYLLGDNDEIAQFDIRINGAILCTVRAEQEDTAGDHPQSGCTAAIYAAEGKPLWYFLNLIQKRRKWFNKINVFATNR